jgi:hypothetical protein
MLSNKDGYKKLLFSLIDASVGNFRQYQITFWAQLILGLLYSFNYFNFALAGIILGLIMPSLWIILTYRFVLVKANKSLKLPFPAWMQKNPGNILVILIDISFLTIIWAIILTGLYDAIWVKVLFTVVFPILTLSMLRNMIIFPFQNDENNPDDSDKNENKKNDDNSNAV